MIRYEVEYSEREYIRNIIEEAKRYRQTRRPSWKDYEYFKQRLHDGGVYGYEKELADALGI